MKDLALKVVEEKLSSLPRDVNELVINTFKKVEALEAANETLNKEVERLKESNENLYKDLRNVENQRDKLIELETRKSNLEERERNLAIVQLKHELDVANKSKLDIYNLVNMLMKNPRAIEMINIAYSQNPIYNSQGLVSGYENSGEFGTIEKKETKSDDNYID